MSQSYYSSFIKDNITVIAGVLLGYISKVILIPIIIKTVGVSIYGGFVLLSSIFGIIFGISSFGVGFRARRFLPSAPDMETRSALYYPQFFFQLASILSLTALLLIFDRQIRIYIFKDEIEYSTLIIPAYLFSYVLYSQGSDYFRYTSRVHYMTAATLFFPYLHIGFILLFYCLYHFLNVNVLMVSLSLSAVLVAIPCFWVIFKEIGMRLSFYNVKDLVSDIRLGFPLVLVFLVDFILAVSDRYFIALYMTVTDVGYYVPGYALGSLIIFIPKAMGTALPQLFSKAVDTKNVYAAQRMLNYAIKIFILLAIPFIFGSIALGRPILTLLANREVAEHAYWVAPIVATGTLFYGLNLFLSDVLFVRMKTAAIFKTNLFAAIFNLIANAILIFVFKNILVAAFTTLASYFIAFLYISRIIRAESWHIDYQFPVIMKSTAASIAMFGAVMLFAAHLGNKHQIILLVGGVLLAAGVYFCVLFATKSFSKKELQFVKGLISRGAAG